MASVRVQPTLGGPLGESPRRVLVDLRSRSVREALRAGRAPHVSADWSQGPVELGPMLDDLVRAVELAPTPQLGSQRTSHSGSLASLHEEDAVRTWYSSMPPTGSAGGPVASAASPIAAFQPTPHAQLLQPLTLLLALGSLALGAMVGTAGLLGGVLLVATDRTPTLAAAAPPPTEITALPDWLEPPFQRTDAAIEIVGTGRASLATDGLALADRDMMMRYLDYLAPSVESRTEFDVDLPRASDLPDAERDVAITAFMEQTGPWAYPDRLTEVIREGAPDVFVAARYALDPEAWTRVARLYADSDDFRGITVAPVFPTLAPSVGREARIMVVATRPWMRSAQPGDIITAVQGQPVHSLESYREALQKAWSATEPGRWMRIEIRRHGNRRRLSFRKPL